MRESVEGLVYLEYSRVPVPSSELGPPTPSPASECVSPIGHKGGVGVSNTVLRVRGWGSQFGRMARMLGTL
jgi:hypothetical protein